MPAESKRFIIIRVSFFKCSSRSTMQDAFNGLRSDNFEVIFTSMWSTPRFSCVKNSFENHSLYMFWIKAFATLFTLIFRGWNLLAKYEEQWQLHNSFLSNFLLTYRYPDLWKCRWTWERTALLGIHFLF